MQRLTPKKIRLKEGLAEAELRIATCFETKANKLDLSNLGLKALPNSLRKLTWLQELEAQNNKLINLPEWLGELTKLHELIIYSNPLQSLPSSLGQLHHLGRLFIASSSPAVADEIIGSLTNLWELSLQGLKLTQLPNWVRNLKKLKTLLLMNLSSYLWGVVSLERRRLFTTWSQANSKSSSAHLESTLPSGQEI